MRGDVQGLIDELEEVSAQSGPSALAMVKDKRTGLTFSIEAIEFEAPNSDGGPPTVWIQVEEF